ncbi:hypothetical protein JCM10207_001481 [Rhodosporidiobolus poonsookiae]
MRLFILAYLAAAFATASAQLVFSPSDASSSNAAPDLGFVPPTPPALEWLYRAYVICPPDLLDGSKSPVGVRRTIPITGGNLTFADGTHGKIRNLGADDGLVDPRTGIFSADTRYHALLDDGTDLYFRTHGAQQPNGELHLSVGVESGSEKWYFLNHRNIVGVLNIEEVVNGTMTLKIDAYSIPGEWRNITFIDK